MVDLSDIATAISMGVLREDAKVDTSDRSSQKYGGVYATRTNIADTEFPTQIRKLTTQTIAIVDC